MELIGPGRRLMDARNAQNMSREDVAQQLKLKLKTIIAIEEDRVDELPAPMYVIGYLRNYAKLLRIPHEPVVNAYEQLQVEAPPIISEVVKPKGKSSSAKVIKLGSTVIALVLVAGFISWLMNQDLDIPVVTKNAKNDTAVSEVETIEQVDTVPGNQEVVESLALETAEQPVVTENEPGQVEIIEAKQPEVSQASPDGDKIVLMLRGDCWAEIVDASGNRVIYDLLKKGERYTFYARKPYRVFFGNAAVVDMDINDKPYDITPYIRGKLARFKVGDNEGA